MLKYYLFFSFLILCGCKEPESQRTNEITPNHFSGTDTERIQAAVDKASSTTGKMTIPAYNDNGSAIWLLDSAILLPDDITIVLENCTIQLSDSCRDNMFRSDNVGEGIETPKWNQNISIYGIGDVTLKGARNPRSTGDASKQLSLTPQQDIDKSGDYHISYGSDAGRKGKKQTGDWRNILLLMAYVDGYEVKNVTIENTHAWAMSHERVVNAELSNIRINSPHTSTINGQNQVVRNRDGINLRHGCKNFRINDVSGVTGDDFVALSTLGLFSDNTRGGSLNSTMVTSRAYRASEDDTEQIFITNVVCESSTRAIAIRANDIASINNVFINGVMSRGGYNTFLVGGTGYGKKSVPGRINNIHAINFSGNGRSLLQIEEPIANCSFMNGIFSGEGSDFITYKLDKSKTSNIITKNLIRGRN